MAELGGPKLDGPRIEPRSGKARQLVVFLHGYGADGNDLIEIGRAWAGLLPDAAFVSPHAPNRCGQAPVGREWFALTFRDPGERWTGVNQAAPALNGFLDAELARRQLPPSALALVGFSQGTMMALHVGLRRPQRGRLRVTSGADFTILSRCPITRRQAALRQPWEVRGASLERARIAQRVSGAGAQCGLPAAELLPLVAVVLAGHDQGGIPRTREHRRQLRPRGAQPQPRNQAAERGLAQDLREALDASGVHAVQRVPARPFLLPVLRRARGPHLRPPAAALARRAHHLDQRGHRLLGLQSAQGQPDAARGQDVSLADAVPAHGVAPAPQRAGISAELPARKLARLSLLGYRTGAVRRARTAGARRAVSADFLRIGRYLTRIKAAARRSASVPMAGAHRRSSQHE